MTAIGYITMETDGVPHVTNKKKKNLIGEELDPHAKSRCMLHSLKEHNSSPQHVLYLLNFTEKHQIASSFFWSNVQRPCINRLLLGISWASAEAWCRHSNHHKRKQTSSHSQTLTSVYNTSAQGIRAVLSTPIKKPF